MVVRGPHCGVLFPNGLFLLSALWVGLLLWLFGTPQTFFSRTGLSIFPHLRGRSSESVNVWCPAAFHFSFYVHYNFCVSGPDLSGRLRAGPRRALLLPSPSDAGPAPPPVAAMNRGYMETYLQRRGYGQSPVSSSRPRAAGWTATGGVVCGYREQARKHARRQHAAAVIDQVHAHALMWGGGRSTPPYFV